MCYQQIRDGGVCDAVHIPKAWSTVHLDIYLINIFLKHAIDFLCESFRTTTFAYRKSIREYAVIERTAMDEEYIQSREQFWDP